MHNIVRIRIRTAYEMFEQSVSCFDCLPLFNICRLIGLIVDSAKLEISIATTHIV